MLPREQINRYLDSYGDRDKIVGLIVNPSDFHEFHRTGDASVRGNSMVWAHWGHSYQVEADHRCPEGGFWVVLQAETRETSETRELQANAQEGNDRPSIFEDCPENNSPFPYGEGEWYFRQVRCADGTVRVERIGGPPTFSVEEAREEAREERCSDGTLRGVRFGGLTTFTTGGIARDALLARPGRNEEIGRDWHVHHTFTTDDGARPAPAPPVTSPAVEEDRGW